MLHRDSFNTFSNRAACLGSTLFAYGNTIRYDLTLADLISNSGFVLCTKVNVYLYNYSQWVELIISIYEGHG